MSYAPLLLLLLPLALLGLQLLLRRRLERVSYLRPPRQVDRSSSPGLVPWATEVDLSSCPLCSSPAFLAPLDAQGYYLVFDTETQDAIDEQPRVEEDPAEALPPPSPVIALSWALLDEGGRLLQEEYHLLKQDGRISAEATAVHGLREQDLQAEGKAPEEVLTRFLRDLEQAQVVVAHHLPFHRAMLVAQLQALGLPTDSLLQREGYCSMQAGKALAIKRRSSGEASYPRLGELFGHLYFGRPQISVRYTAKALRDVRLTTACLRALRHLPAYLPREAFAASPSTP